MGYESVDRLQKLLAEEVFSYTDDRKKAAGRALGTFLEIITYYLIKTWGLERFTAIEKPLPEFANAEITHNVEFTLHGSRKVGEFKYDRSQFPISSKTVSALQRIRKADGSMAGFLQKSENDYVISDYYGLLSSIIDSGDVELLRNFILTVGVVSNHGNWFTSETPNKELKVLAQSYDWLLFLTDGGISEFITELLVAPKPKYESDMKRDLSKLAAKDWGSVYGAF